MKKRDNLENKDNRDLEQAVEMIEQLEKQPEKKAKSADPDTLLNEINDVFNGIIDGIKPSEDTKETTVEQNKDNIQEILVEDLHATQTKKKKIKERRSKKKNRKEKFAYIAQQSAMATEEMRAAEAIAAEKAIRSNMPEQVEETPFEEETPEKETVPAEAAQSEIVEHSADKDSKQPLTEIIDLMSDALDEISQMKSEKDKETRDDRCDADTSPQNHSVEEIQHSDTETHPESEVSETALNEPQETRSEAEEIVVEQETEESSDEEEKAEEEEPSVSEETTETDDQLPQYLQPTIDDHPDIPDVDISRTSRASDQRWQVFFALGALLLIVMVYFGITYFGERNSDTASVISREPDIEEKEPEQLRMDPELRNMWLTNKAINRDYIGNVIFDSGLVNLPIVQAKDVYDSNGDLYTFYTEDGELVTLPEGYTGNDVYIWTNWKTGEYDRNGDGESVFMDFRNNLNDQNLIIYGHHFARDYDPAGDRLFTPLDVLLDQENYEANKSLKLILDNEIREYVITNVFVIDIDNEYELNIMRKNMNEDYSGNPDPDFYKEFISYMDSISKFDTGEQLSEEDKIMTLVTCIQHQQQYRQIIICKETERTLYE